MDTRPVHSWRCTRKEVVADLPFSSNPWFFCDDVEGPTVLGFSQWLLGQVIKEKEVVGRPWPATKLSGYIQREMISNILNPQSKDHNNLHNIVSNKQSHIQSRKI